MIERREYIIKEILIIGIIITLTILFSVKIDTVTVNMGNIGLPGKAIEELRKILGR